MTTHDRNNGFTLVEVLVAVTIFAIAITTLFASFNIVISNVQPIRTGLDHYEMAQNAMDRIQKDLLSLCLTHAPVYTPPDRDDPDDSDRFRFFSDPVELDGNLFSQLQFASFEHLNFNRGLNSRIGIIAYRAEQSKDNGVLLKRSDIAAAFQNTAEENSLADDPVLCENVKTFELIFIDQDGNPHDYWDSDASDFGYGTPYAVKIKLETGTIDKTVVFSTTLILPTFRDRYDTQTR